MANFNASLMILKKTYGAKEMAQQLGTLDSVPLLENPRWSKKTDFYHKTDGWDFSRKDAFQCH